MRDVCDRDSSQAERFVVDEQRGEAWGTRMAAQSSTPREVVETPENQRTGNVRARDYPPAKRLVLDERRVEVVGGTIVDAEAREVVETPRD